MTARRQRTILLVEDDEDVRAYFAAALEGGGFRVVAAADGEAALRLIAETGPIDLMLTDIRMPKLDGLELARRVAAARPGLRVLFISGYPGADSGEIDTRRLIQKPVGPAALLRRVRGALRSRRLLAES
jgi:CheY-like chemotaxis protein